MATGRMVNVGYCVYVMLPTFAAAVIVVVVIIRQAWPSGRLALER